jgi:hypothetical protein
MEFFINVPMLCFVLWSIVTANSSSHALVLFKYLFQGVACCYFCYVELETLCASYLAVRIIESPALRKHL